MMLQLVAANSKSALKIADRVTKRLTNALLIGRPSNCYVHPCASIDSKRSEIRLASLQNGFYKTALIQFSNQPAIDELLRFGSLGFGILFL